MMTACDRPVPARDVPGSGLWRRRCACLLTGVLAAPVALAAPPADEDERRNWFDDPFFQISADVPDCPLPMGPYMTEAERRVQTHHRAEKGTTCWLAGQCERPSFYAYDQDIAAALRLALHRHPPAQPSTLWVTVQGRVVYIEGCATDDTVAAALEATARSVEHVQQAIAVVRTDPSARPPYRLRAAP